MRGSKHQRQQNARENKAFHRPAHAPQTPNDRDGEIHQRPKCQDATRPAQRSGQKRETHKQCHHDENGGAGAGRIAVEFLFE